MAPNERAAWHGYLLVIEGVAPVVRQARGRGEATAEFAALHAHLDRHAVAWGLDGLRLLGVATRAHVMHRRGDHETAFTLLQALARRLFAMSSPTAAGRRGDSWR
ncbi:hypothetical protein Cs7R123_48040 [Catellatospora sp. TT07R-123]|uniref:hypothetical protein n=1 Tax=Catellatospora sp. TT07R-123 TaxID=2733863 RepID=UPI001B1AD7F1|nr:hypothetical protein [Catellatospora sp. TT07R-123]GHJ47462.1 hypothetical protein Cs7R123_48040 [Catellatospora sp. TT07R-123]